MRLRALLLAALLPLAACEQMPGESRVETSPDVADLVERGLAHPLLIGTPEGEAVLFPAGGVYTPAQLADPAVTGAQAALGVAAMDLGDLAAEADDWDAAHAAAAAYVAAPPQGAAELPGYVLEQVAAQTLYTRFPDAFVALEHHDDALGLVRTLVRNRYPDPAPVAAFLAAAEGRVAVDDGARLASEALEASVAYDRAIAEVEATLDCDQCVSARAGRGTSWASAREALAAYDQ